MKLNSYDWLSRPKYTHMIVMDPDGWDRMNYEESMKEELTEEEFLKRLNSSSVMIVNKKEK